MAGHIHYQNSGVNIITNTRKYSRQALLDPGKIKKGKTRWNQFSEILTGISQKALHGPLLDFGCGVGHFVLEGLRRDMDIWGVDILPGKIERYRLLVDFTDCPAIWQQRCMVAGGDELPFAADSFSALSSWYVFEHIENPAPCIREMVRVTRPGGIIVIRAQDARNGWEGHCRIPWVPFLSEPLAAAWIEEFGASPEMRRDVYDITQPQVGAIFEALGCTIVKQAPAPAVLIENHRQLCSEADIRSMARRIKQEWDNGRWHPQPENLYIFARKL